MSVELFKKANILVLGAGHFGTCLSQVLAQNGHHVIVWSRDSQVVRSINEQQRNPKYLSEFTLHKNISATTDLTAKELQNISSIVLAIPTQALRSVLQMIKTTLLVRYDHHDKLLVCAAKGIELGTLKLPLEIVCDVLGDSYVRHTGFLSGPSFAREIMAQQPTAVSVAASLPNVAKQIQQLFHAPYFRVYTHTDVIGLELAGALKNVMAIAAGAVKGLGYGENARAALITRGLAEIIRIGKKLGACERTFLGLGGVGDLFLTCNSTLSRNFTVGFRLGQGESLNEIAASMGSVAEGVPTTQAAYELSQKHQVEMPIVDQVYQLLYKQKPMKQAVVDLITRAPKSEWEGGQRR